MAAFPRHSCKYLKYYDRYQVKTRYIVDAVIEVGVLLIFAAMVNL